MIVFLGWWFYSRVEAALANQDVATAAAVCYADAQVVALTYSLAFCNSLYISVLVVPELVIVRVSASPGTHACPEPIVRGRVCAVTSVHAVQRVVVAGTRVHAPRASGIVATAHSTGIIGHRG